MYPAVVGVAVAVADAVGVGVAVADADGVADAAAEAVGFGVIVGMAFVPPLSDAYGRKVIFIITLIISVVFQLALILTNDLY